MILESGLLFWAILYIVIIHIACHKNTESYTWRFSGVLLNWPDKNYSFIILWH